MSRRENPTSKFLKYYRSLDPAAREVVRDMVIDEIRPPKKKGTSRKSKPAAASTQPEA